MPRKCRIKRNGDEIRIPEVPAVCWAIEGTDAYCELEEYAPDLGERGEVVVVPLTALIFEVESE